jgi:hypothetical protein
MILSVLQYLVVTNKSMILNIEICNNGLPQKLARFDADYIGLCREKPSILMSYLMEHRGLYLQLCGTL